MGATGELYQNTYAPGKTGMLANATLVEAVARRSDPIAGDLNWLRERRNELAHAGGADAMIDDQAMQQTAEGAVRTVFKTLFAEAWSQGATK